MANTRAKVADLTARLGTATPDEAGPEPAAVAAAEPARGPARKARRAMPAETKPAPDYPARMSHATTHEQLDGLEDLSRSLRRERPDLGAVPVTALLRAAAAICLDDERLRARMIREARTTWAARKR
jgi:hypothetical protein